MTTELSRLICHCAHAHPAVQGLAAQLQGQRLGAEQVAGALLGQRCWVKWPYLQEAVVEAVSDAGAQGEGSMGGGLDARRSLPGAPTAARRGGTQHGCSAVRSDANLRKF